MPNWLKSVVSQLNGYRTTNWKLLKWFDPSFINRDRFFIIRPPSKFTIEFPGLDWNVSTIRYTIDVRSLLLLVWPRSVTPSHPQNRSLNSSKNFVCFSLMWLDAFLRVLSVISSHQRLWNIVSPNCQTASCESLWNWTAFSRLFDNNVRSSWQYKSISMHADGLGLIKHKNLTRYGCISSQVFSLKIKLYRSFSYHGINPSTNSNCHARDLVR